MDISAYQDYINKPWGRLFYRLVWHRLPFSGKNILDFGSGLGVTADHLAQCNAVTAVEPDSEMLAHRLHDHSYRQIQGGMEQLPLMPEGSFDVILCHNVLEYVEDRSALLEAFSRLLKPGGILSVVKHGKKGKIMHKAVFENNIDEAMQLLGGGVPLSQHFGAINEYEVEALQRILPDCFVLEKLCGIRTFYGIQPNVFKNDPQWEERMFRLECAVEEDPSYADIAFFQHLLFRKMQ